MSGQLPLTPSQPRVAVVLLGGGSGSRVGAEVNKVLLPLAGRPVLSWSLDTIRSLSPALTVVVARPQDREAFAALLTDETLVEGGAERHDSEWNALQALAPAIDAGEVDVVAIHDGARPLTSSELWQEVTRTAWSRGGAIPARPMPGVVDHDGRSMGEVVGVQTPQAFRASDLLAAYRAAERERFHGTDTASCLERYTDVDVAAVVAPATNLKITFPEDVALAERLLERGW